MLRRFAVVTLLGICAVAALHAQLAPAGHLAMPRKLEIPKTGTMVMMDNIDGRPLVDVMVNGKGPFPFILDTGADVSVIDDDLQSQLSLPAAKLPEQSNAFKGMGAVVSAQELRLGDAVMLDVTLGSAPIARMFHTEKKPRGVMSAASFPGCLLILDYPAKRVVVQHGELSDADDRRIFQYKEEDLLPTVTLRIGDQQIRAHIDAGSPGGVTVPNRYIQLLPLSSKPTEVGRAHTPHGDSIVMRASLAKPVELGQYQLEVPEVSFADLQAGEVSGLGNVGFKVLQNFVVTLDSKNYRIKLEQ